MGVNWKTVGSLWTSGNTFFQCSGYRPLPQFAKEAVVPPPWRSPKAAWIWAWAYCSGCPWLHRGWALCLCNSNHQKSSCSVFHTFCIILFFSAVNCSVWSILWFTGSQCISCVYPAFLFSTYIQQNCLEENQWLKWSYDTRLVTFPDYLSDEIFLIYFVKQTILAERQETKVQSG